MEATSIHYKMSSRCSSPTFSTYKPLLSFPSNLTKATQSHCKWDHLWLCTQHTLKAITNHSLQWFCTGVFTVKIHGQVTAGCLNISMACNVSMGDHFTLQSQWCDSAQKGNHRRPLEQLQQLGVAWMGCFKNCTDFRVEYNLIYHQLVRMFSLLILFLYYNACTNCQPPPPPLCCPNTCTCMTMVNLLRGRWEKPIGIKILHHGTWRGGWGWTLIGIKGLYCTFIVKA